jgi:hypothetical protein
MAIRCRNMEEFNSCRELYFIKSKLNEIQFITSIKLQTCCGTGVPVSGIILKHGIQVQSSNLGSGAT